MQNEINELRTQVRTLKRIVCFVCCLFGVFVFAGCSSASKQSMPDIIQAKLFQVVNSKGKVVGQFGTHNDLAIYHIFDKEGNTIMCFQDVKGTVLVTGSFAMPNRNVTNRNGWSVWSADLEGNGDPPPPYRSIPSEGNPWRLQRNYNAQ